MRQAAWRVPGRLEVLGKHTDYAGGKVLVCAVDRGVTARATLGSDAALVARSDEFAEPVTLHPGTDPGLPPGHWGRYLQVVLDRFTQVFGPLPGAEMSVASDLPMASGMSSSSALLVATALAWADVAELPASATWRELIGDDPLRLATFLASVETGRPFGRLAGHGGVGTLGGSEDHTAMLCSHAGELGVFGFSPAARLRRVPWPSAWAFVVATSGVAAEKTGAAQALYNRASLATATALQRWNAATRRCDATLADAVRSDPDAPARRERLLADDEYLSARFVQFVRESEVLVPAAAEALASGDMAGFAAAAEESQRLADTHLGNQVPQTRALASAAPRLGALAASAFGAGFGGSVWALVPVADADAFASAWITDFRRAFPAEGQRADAVVTTPASAAGPVAAE